MPQKSTPKSLTLEEQKVRKLIHECLNACQGESCIFRGLSQETWEVSSTLYRYLKKLSELIPDKFMIQDVEEDIIKEAKTFFPSTSSTQILTELRHYGQELNVIDFSYNLYVALFFACSKPEGKNVDGKLIILKKPDLSSDIDYSNKQIYTITPKFISGQNTSQNRVIAQSSVFVKPAQGKGLIEEGEIIADILINKDIKKPLLEYLNRYHHISANTIYNDIFGFIQQRQEKYFKYFYQGLMFQRNNKYDEAITHYNRATKANPQFAEGYNNRGTACSSLGDKEEDTKKSIEHYEQAIKDCTQAIQINPQLAEGYNNRGHACSSLGDKEEDTKKSIEHYEQAIKDCTQAIQINPQSAEAYSNRGYAYVSLGGKEEKKSIEYYKQAIEDCTQAIQINPQLAEAYNNRGYAYFFLEGKEEDTEKSIEYYKQAIKDFTQVKKLYEQQGNDAMVQVVNFILEELKKKLTD